MACAIWNHSGLLLGQLDDTHEGMMLLDTGTQACFVPDAAAL